MDIPSKLLSRISTAAEIVRRHDFIHIFSHYDADGISAATVAAKAIHRDGRGFIVTLFQGLTDSTMRIVEKSDSRCILITDLGASYLDRLEAMGKDTVVLDHHRTPRDSERICYANPHLAGADGARECCASSLAFLFAAEMNETNWDLSQIALAGIAGDKQLGNVTGINTSILNGAVGRGYVEAAGSSLIPPGNLNKELLLTTDPYISGVSGNAAGVAELLSSAGIARSAVSSGLGDAERRRLSSLIAMRLVSEGVTVRAMEDASRTRYHLKDWNMDAEMLAGVMDACGRTGLGGVGIGMGLGDGRCRIEAERMNDDYRNRIVLAAAELERNGLTRMKNIQYFDSSASGFTGVLCGITMDYFGDPSVPTVGVNTSETIAKASGRGTRSLIARGLDLAAAMRSAGEAAGGEGGGHNIASGASFPPSSRQKFLDTLDRIIGEQISAR
jgi:RecJ-like exonuclease